MCGIVGFLDRRGGRSRPLGGTLLAMLEALGCRGPDSAGVALFGEPRPGWVLRLKPPDRADDAKVAAALRACGLAAEGGMTGGTLRLAAPVSTSAADLEARLLVALPDAEVVSLGRRLEIFKQVGTPRGLDEAYGIAGLHGSHGIGHTRLSTESRVDLSHSQPFWSHGVPDLVTVHNGHITNYHKLRRRYEQKGRRFYTENDSELIGVYLRDRLAAGLSLPDALRSSLDDFDGSFSYLAAWEGGLGYVRDRFGFKPLILWETAECVALATEEIALHAVLGTGHGAREVEPGSVRVWQTTLGSVVAGRRS
jgi:glutamate synthase domain-containing protein 1